jgi:predicted kinase
MSRRSCARWWGGVRRTDPEGYECRIGAAASRLLLPPGWAIVLAGKVWVRDAATWRTYLRQEAWRAHEHHHVWQERHVFRSTPRYALAFVWQYIRYRSHDAAPLEREAEEAARRYVAVLRAVRAQADPSEPPQGRDA